MTPVQLLLGSVAGSLVGVMLGTAGGGGSILAVPLMIYVVGVASPHVAIGTSAVAVAANAAFGLARHARSGHVDWRCGWLFAAFGVAGALLGARLGKAVDGGRLMLLFSVLMLVVAARMFATRPASDAAPPCFTHATARRLAGTGAGAGMVSGFFGIGGGFLIVPGLMRSAQLPALTAVATSLVAVTAFGLTTATSYAASGFVDWRLAAVFVAGGSVGVLAGTNVARRLAAGRCLTPVLAGLILCVGLYVFVRSVV